MKHGNLLCHLLIGDHKLIPQRLSLCDAAINSYSKQLESVQLTPKFPELQEALQAFYQHEEPNLLEKGWALMSPKSCKLSTAKRQNFLLEKYNEGIIQNKKFDAGVISKKMRPNPSFSKEEFLSPQQIASFWSRKASHPQEEDGTY